jgi:arylsulfatase A-like enzyme
MIFPAMKERLLIPLGLAAGSLPVAVQSCTEEERERPNILFILSDDHTSQAWGVYGGILSGYAHSENIRRLAAEGCVLDNCFCTNSISVPSRAAMLTGAYSHRNGVYTLSDALPPEADNFAKRLQAGGYQTALFGKWHLAKKPAGFDDFCVFNGQGAYHNPVMKSADSWRDDADGVHGDTVKGFSADVVADLTIRWIRNRKKGKPFLACCHFKATHEPFDFPDRLKHLYDGVVFPEPESLLDFDTAASGRTFVGQQLENLSARWELASKDPERWWCVYPELPFSVQGLGREAARKKTYQKLVKDYLRCGAAIDENIGRLLQALDDEGISRNTVVVYVSDQGYFLGEHGFFDKRMMYEESLRMPFVIRYPKEIPAGTRSRDIILNVDFAALLADYAGVQPPETSQGSSFRQNLKGSPPGDWRQSMYYRYWTHHKVRPAHFGVRNHRYKLIFLYGDPLDTKGSEHTPVPPAWEFFDLTTDPYEMRNQYQNPQYHDAIAQMKKELLRLREEVGDTDPNAPHMQEMLRQRFATCPSE